MSKIKYVLVITEINSSWVKLSFEDGEFITIPRNKFPQNEKLYIGQAIELTIKTTSFLTILKNIQNITKNKNEIQGEINRLIYEK